MPSDLTVPELNYQEETERILNFIRDQVNAANAAGVVVGLSGGVDSSLVATLCVQAITKENVLGVLMPTSFTPYRDNEDAKLLAHQLGIRTKFVNIDRISRCFFEDLDINPDDPATKMPMANIRARIRMVILYYYANRYNYLVAGTGDRSESLIGFFTKYGDGGADFM
ncbi:MAG: NAD(+) synthase, partial [Nitrososphaerota archaeon]